VQKLLGALGEAGGAAITLPDSAAPDPPDLGPDVLVTICCTGEAWSAIRRDVEALGEINGCTVSVSV